MKTRDMPRVRSLGRQDAFARQLRDLLGGPRPHSVAGLASMVGMDRVRLYQILAQTTPPPGPEIIDRISTELGLSASEGRWLHWLAIRDRCDPHCRVLLERYEGLLMKLWRTEDLREIPEKLGEALELTNFVVTNKPVYLRHSHTPVGALVHDEAGRMGESLVDGWIVRVEPAGMHESSFLRKALNNIVLLNVGRQCRIGWLKKKDKYHTLLDDQDQPLTMGSPGPRGRRETNIRIHETASRRPYVKDIQALISSATLGEIKRMRDERERSEQERRHKDVLDSARAV